MNTSQVERPRTHLPSQPSEGTNPDFRLLTSRTMRPYILCSKSLSLWYFITAVLVNNRTSNTKCKVPRAQILFAGIQSKAQQKTRRPNPIYRRNILFSLLPVSVILSEHIQQIFIYYILNFIFLNAYNCMR